MISSFREDKYSQALAVAFRFVRTAFSPDGSHFVTGSVDGAAYVWEVRVRKAKIALKHSVEV
jgi:WD40 repeat protein